MLKAGGGGVMQGEKMDEGEGLSGKKEEQGKGKESEKIIKR